MWKFLDTGKRSAKQNMAIDAHLLKNLPPNGSPVLHFYDWENRSITYGCFINPATTLLNLKQAHLRGIDVEKRPTGGGVIFHGYDLTFSALVPVNYKHYSSNVIGRYNLINARVKKAIEKVIDVDNSSLLSQDCLPLSQECRYFCMANPTRCDVMIQGRKVAGAAQRRTKRGYLQQVSIAIAPLEAEFLYSLFSSGSAVVEAMLCHSYSILGHNWDPSTLRHTYLLLKHHLKEQFMQ